LVFAQIYIVDGYLKSTDFAKKCTLFHYLINTGLVNGNNVQLWLFRKKEYLS